MDLRGQGRRARVGQHSTEPKPRQIPGVSNTQRGSIAPVQSGGVQIVSIRRLELPVVIDGEFAEDRRFIDKRRCPRARARVSMIPSIASGM